MLNRGTQVYVFILSLYYIRMVWKQNCTKVTKVWPTSEPGAVDSTVEIAVWLSLKTSSRASCKLTKMEGIVHNKVYHLLLLFVCLISLTGIGFASACQTTTMDHYLGPPPISCGIDDKTFSNFFYSSTGTGGALAIPPSGVEVNPLDYPRNPGFLFTAAWGVGSGETQDELLGFTVTVNPGGAPITDASLAILGAGFFGTGSVSVAETLCLGDLFSDNCAHGTTKSLFVFSNSAGTKLTDQIDFSGVTEIDVRKDIELIGGANGTAALSGVQNNFSEGTVPEPSSMVLFGSGVLGLAGVLRRKMSI